MFTMGRNIWFLLLVFVTGLAAQAGGTPERGEIERARKKFPDADAVFLKRITHTTITDDKGELNVSSDFDEEIYYADDKSDFYRKYAVYHSYFTEINDLKAVTLSNTDGKLREVKVEHFNTEDNVDANVFYDDLKEVNFVFPAVAPGSVGKVTYTEKLKDPHFISPFYFVSYVPVAEAEYSVTFPSNVKLNYRLFNNDSNQVVFSKEERGKSITYRWKASNLQSPKREGSAPAFAYYTPHVIITISEYTDNGSTHKIIPDLNGLCEWYHTFVKDINAGQDTTLASIVSSLTKSAKTSEEKIRNIYYWVQDNINYVAFEDGMNGFVPREAKDICTRRYGDCKDMTSILVKMLQMAGIDAHYTWIGTRSLPYKYSDLPSPNIDNHMICVADADGKRYVLDGTGKYTPLGFVTGFIQGKEALVMKKDGNCEVYTIPVMPKEKSVEADSIDVNFEGSKLLKGIIQTKLTGYYKIDQAYAYHYAQPEKREERYQNYLKMGNNKCKITNLRYQGFEGQDSALILRGDFELADYVKSVGEKIYMNPNLEKDDQFSNIDLSERTLPLEIEFKRVKKSTTVIRAPEGYKLNYKPDDVNYKDSHESFSINYKVDGENLIQQKNIETDFLTLPLDQLKNWNAMINTMDKAYKEDIVFIKK